MKLIATGAASAAVLLAATALAPDADARAGDRKDYDITNFDSIEVSAGIEVLFTQDSAYTVEVESLDGGFDKIKLEKDGDTLVIKRPGQRWNRGQQPRYKVYVTAPELTDVEATSASSFRASAIDTSDLDLEVSSAASIRIGALSADEVDADSSSAGSIEIAAGACSELSADASSGSSISAGDLACESVEADVSSGASITARASQDVVADASSGGSVTVLGGPESTEIDKSSGGSVSIRG